MLPHLRAGARSRLRHCRPVDILWLMGAILLLALILVLVLYFFNGEPSEWSPGSHVGSTFI